jgi:hypothetical protein
MADAKVFDLAAASALTGVEIFYVDDSGAGTTGHDKKVTAKQNKTYANSGRTGLTDGATINTDASLNNVFSVTLGGNRTLANPTNMVDGATYIWIITQDGTGSRTLAYGANFKWPAGAAPTLTTTAGAIDVISAVYNGSVLLANCQKGFA